MPKTAADGARFSIEGTWSALTPIANIFEAVVDELTGNTRAAALQQYAEVLSDAWTNGPVSRSADNYTHTHVDWVDLNSVNGPTGTFTRATPAVGAITAAFSPQNLARLVTKNLVGSARGQRAGRFYWVGVQEGGVGETGALDPSAQALDQAQLDEFLTAVTITTEVGAINFARLVVIQWPSIEVPQPSKRVTDPDGVGDPVDVSSLQLQPTISTQRRRVRP